MNKNQDKKIKNNLINILNNIFSNDKIKKENEFFITIIINQNI
jgi:hypothetical protein